MWHIQLYPAQDFPGLQTYPVTSMSGPNFQPVIFTYILPAEPPIQEFSVLEITCSFEKNHQNLWLLHHRVEVQVLVVFTLHKSLGQHG